MAEKYVSLNVSWTGEQIRIDTEGTKKDGLGLAIAASAHMAAALRNEMAEASAKDLLPAETFVQAICDLLRQETMNAIEEFPAQREQAAWEATINQGDSD